MTNRVSNNIGYTTKGGISLDFTQGFTKELLDVEKSPPKRTLQPGHVAYSFNQPHSSYSQNFHAQNSITRHLIDSTGITNEHQIFEWQQDLNDQLKAISDNTFHHGNDRGEEKSIEILDIYRVLSKIQPDCGDQDGPGTNKENNIAYSGGNQEKSSKALSDFFKLLRVLTRQVLDKREDLYNTNESQEKVLMMEKEIERKNNKIGRLEEEILTEKRQVSEIENRLKAKQAAFLREKTQLKEEKKEIERKLIQLKHVDVQYKATMKKKETEYTRLQKHLRDQLQKSTSDVFKAMKMTNVLNGTIACQKAHDEAERVSDDFSSMVISNYKSQQQELLYENNVLKNSLQDLYTQLKQLLVDYKSAARLFLFKNNKAENTQEWDSLMQISLNSFSNSVFDMPLKWTKNTLIDHMKNVMMDLDLKINLLKESQKADFLKEEEDTVEILKLKLEEAKEIIMAQDELIKESFSSLKDDTSEKEEPESLLMQTESILNLSDIAEKEEMLQIDKKDFELKMKHLEEERELFREKAKHLDHEFLLFHQNQTINLQEPLDPHTPLKTHRFFPSRTPNSSHRIRFPLPIPATPVTKSLLKSLGGIVEEDKENMVE